jgi:molybdopterin-guanine dinucleotide biosynthesis protein A
VGQGCSGLPCSREEPGGAGPLAALAAGVSHLWSLGHRGPALVLACDLPFVGAAALRVLAGWPGGASVVPVADGRPQPLCARWSAHDLELAVELVAQGERAMKALLRAATVCLVDEAALVAASPTGTGQLGGVGRLLADVDTPEDLRRFGLTPPARRTPARRRRCGQ